MTWLKFAGWNSGRSGCVGWSPQGLGAKFTPLPRPLGTLAVWPHAMFPMNLTCRKPCKIQVQISHQNEAIPFPCVLRRFTGSKPVARVFLGSPSLPWRLAPLFRPSLSPLYKPGWNCLRCMIYFSPSSSLPFLSKILGIPP